MNNVIKDIRKNNSINGLGKTKAVYVKIKREQSILKHIAFLMIKIVNGQMVSLQKRVICFRINGFVLKD